MRVIQRDFFGLTRKSVIRIIPIGDVHIGAAACDEKLLKRVVKRIAKDPDCHWIGMGDTCDFINLKDPRFSPGALANWVEISDLMDLAKSQRDRFLDHIKPIAGKCLALVCGNHEASIQRYTERNIYGEIVSAVKGFAGMKSTDRLGIGYHGWLQMRLYRHETERTNGTSFDINLHHGSVGGRLAGAKALHMQRWLWSHNCNLALFGHSHNTAIQIEQVEGVDKGGNLIQQKRIGAYTGTFLRTTNPDGPSTYAEIKSYFPMPLGGVVVELFPGAAKNINVIASV